MNTDPLMAALDDITGDHVTASYALDRATRLWQFRFTAPHPGDDRKQIYMVIPIHERQFGIPIGWNDAQGKVKALSAFLALKIFESMPYLLSDKAFLSHARDRALTTTLNTIQRTVQ